MIPLANSSPSSTGQPLRDWSAPASGTRTPLYIDRRQLNLPTGLDEGSYLFRIGLYNITSGERLPFQPDRNSDNFEDGQLLVPLKVLPSEADVSSCYVCIEETVDRRTRSSFGVRNLLSVSFYNPVLTFARQQSARFCRSPRACRICRQPEWAVSICRLRFLHMPTLQNLRDALPRYLHLISASEERRITQHDIQQEPLIGVRRVTETVPVCKLKIDRRQVDRRTRSLGQGFQCNTFVRLNAHRQDIAAEAVPVQRRDAASRQKRRLNPADRRRRILPSSRIEGEALCGK